MLQLCSTFWSTSSAFAEGAAAALAARRTGFVLAGPTLQGLPSRVTPGCRESAHGMYSSFMLLVRAPLCTPHRSRRSPQIPMSFLKLALEILAEISL